MTDFKAKMHQIRFRLGLRPRPRWGSLQRSPGPTSWIWAASRQGRGWAREEEGKGEGKRREGEVEGGKGRAPSYCWTRAPKSLATPLLRQLPSQRFTSNCVGVGTTSATRRGPRRRQRRPQLLLYQFCRDLEMFLLPSVALRRNVLEVSNVTAL